VNGGRCEWSTVYYGFSVTENSK
ncbi:hypothetical protein TNIN_427381, partial [Trichonephila inaurata madagascariensis]